MNRKEHYNKKGMYAGYDKNHKERSALDYYATPIEEVLNILNILKLNFNKCTILEPCAGEGFMSKGIWDYISQENQLATLLNTDIQKRENKFSNDINIGMGEHFDFLSDDYPLGSKTPIDYIIMNPPFSLIEPFVMKSLGMANKGILMFGRLQFLEGQKRYENILKNFPPTDIYIYVDRIKCIKNGDISIPVGNIQAYAWYFWNFENNNKDTKVHWMRRFDKQ